MTIGISDDRNASTFPPVDGGQKKSYRASKTGMENAVPSRNFLFSGIPLLSFQCLGRSPAAARQEFFGSLSPPSRPVR
jgi:hypothetical protein